MQHPSTGIYKGARQSDYQFEMAFKPVHIITNDDQFLLRVFENEFEFVVGAEDYTAAEGIHYHYLILWPLEGYRLSPSRQGAVKAFRRKRHQYALNDCCFNKGFNYPCPECGLYYKFIWIAGAQHRENTRAYIQRYIDADPTKSVTYAGDQETEEAGEEESDDE